MDKYPGRFLNLKAQQEGDHGFNPLFMPDAPFDFQKALTEWAVKKEEDARYSRTADSVKRSCN